VIIIPTINSFIRFLHASPGTPVIDIYYNDNGNLSVENLDYTEISKFLVTGPDNNNVRVFPAGDNTNPIVDTSVNIPPSEAINLAIIGTQPNVEILPITQSLLNIDPAEVKIRFVNLSEDAPPLDVMFLEGNGEFSNVEYKQITDYITVAPGTYTLEAKQAEDDIIFTRKEIILQGGKAYTVYAVGLVNDSPFLELIYYEDKPPVIDDNKWSNEKITSIPIKELKINFNYC